MDVSAEREDGVSASGVTLSEQHDSQTRDKSPVKQKRPPDKHVPSCVSMKSGRSLSEPIEFQDGDHSDNQIQVKQERPDSPGLSCLSRSSGQSIRESTEFNNGLIVETSQVNQERPDPPGPTCVSVKRIKSISNPVALNNGSLTVERMMKAHRKRSKVLSSRPAQKDQPNLDSIFMVLEENIVTFVKNELKKFKKVLESSERLEVLNEDDEVMESEEEQQRRSNRDVFIKLTLNFLRNMKQEQLADSLQSKTLAAICHRKLKSRMKNTFQCLFEGIARAGNPKPLNRIYTELYIKEEQNGEANEQHEGFLRLLPVVKASKTALLSGCNLSSKSAEALASVLTSKNSLRELDLSNNDLQDIGVTVLSCGLRSLHCKLESLCLSGCLITEKGSADLASALKCNPSHLRELDLSFNHPGDSGVTLLFDGLDDPHWKLKTLK
ncbi:hypothetical protein EPR50_G00008240 [Perca flavescens]|uniref:FISNA domain-containing protein n=1 Tax=Perca flavescens TaxID=8167 RepID=A0A484DRP6_PERFV|nr:hypothetical protein EPR50_G00008240 [Perca flavescens]